MLHLIGDIIRSGDAKTHADGASNDGRHEAMIRAKHESPFPRRLLPLVAFPGENPPADVGWRVAMRSRPIARLHDSARAGQIEQYLCAGENSPLGLPWIPVLKSGLITNRTKKFVGLEASSRGDFYCGSARIISRLAGCLSPSRGVNQLLQGSGDATSVDSLTLASVIFVAVAARWLNRCVAGSTIPSHKIPTIEAAIARSTAGD